MNCPACGRARRDFGETCRHCGFPLPAGTQAPGIPPAGAPEAGAFGDFELPQSAAGQGFPIRGWEGSEPESDGDPDRRFGEDALEIGEDDFALALPAGRDAAADAALFRIDDDLFSGPVLAPFATPEAGETTADAGFGAAAGVGLPGLSFGTSREPAGAGSGGAPIIDNDDEVPDRYWAPEVAGLGVRALALVVDQALVLAVLGLFIGGAVLALRLNGIDADVFEPAAVRASAFPFGLLAVLLSLAYCVYFHGSIGCTPGKALVGIEVRTGSGAGLSWGRALLRWCGALLALGCAGVGLLWAIFEPRHRSWADLVSGTVVARPRRGAAAPSAD